MGCASSKMGCGTTRMFAKHAIAPVDITKPDVPATVPDANAELEAALHAAASKAAQVKAAAASQAAQIEAEAALRAAQLREEAATKVLVATAGTDVMVAKRASLAEIVAKDTDPAIDNLVSGSNSSMPTLLAARYSGDVEMLKIQQELGSAAQNSLKDMLASCNEHEEISPVEAFDPKPATGRATSGSRTSVAAASKVLEPIERRHTLESLTQLPAAKAPLPPTPGIVDHDDNGAGEIAEITEEQAAIKLQAHIRGYNVRKAQAAKKGAAPTELSPEIEEVATIEEKEEEMQTEDAPMFTASRVSAIATIHAEAEDDSYSDDTESDNGSEKGATITKTDNEAAPEATTGVDTGESDKARLALVEEPCASVGADKDPTEHVSEIDAIVDEVMEMTQLESVCEEELPDAQHDDHDAVNRTHTDRYESLEGAMIEDVDEALLEETEVKDAEEEINIPTLDDEAAHAHGKVDDPVEDPGDAAEEKVPILTPATAQDNADAILASSDGKEEVPGASDDTIKNTDIDAGLEEQATIPHDASPGDRESSMGLPDVDAKQSIIASEVEDATFADECAVIATAVGDTTEAILDTEAADDSPVTELRILDAAKDSDEVLDVTDGKEDDSQSAKHSPEDEAHPSGEAADKDNAFDEVVTNTTECSEKAAEQNIGTEPAADSLDTPHGGPEYEAAKGITHSVVQPNTAEADDLAPEVLQASEHAADPAAVGIVVVADEMNGPTAEPADANTSTADAQAHGDDAGAVEENQPSVTDEAIAMESTVTAVAAINDEDETTIPAVDDEDGTTIPITANPECVSAVTVDAGSATVMEDRASLSARDRSISDALIQNVPADITDKPTAEPIADTDVVNDGEDDVDGANGVVGGVIDGAEARKSLVDAGDTQLESDPSAGDAIVENPKVAECGEVEAAPADGGVEVVKESGSGEQTKETGEATLDKALEESNEVDKLLHEASKDDDREEILSGGKADQTDASNAVSEAFVNEVKKMEEKPVEASVTDAADKAPVTGKELGDDEDMKADEVNAAHAKVPDDTSPSSQQQSTQGNDIPVTGEDTMVVEPDTSSDDKRNVVETSEAVASEGTIEVKKEVEEVAVDELSEHVVPDVRCDVEELKPKHPENEDAQLVDEHPVDNPISGVNADATEEYMLE